MKHLALPTRLAVALALLALPVAACDSDDGGGGSPDTVADVVADVPGDADVIVSPACADRDPLEPFQIEVLVDGESYFAVPLGAAEEVAFTGSATVVAAPSGPIGATTLTLDDADATEITLTTNLPGSEVLDVALSDVLDVTVTITDDRFRDLRVTLRDAAGELVLDSYDGRLLDTPVLETCGPIGFSCGTTSLATIDVPVSTPALGALTGVALSETEAEIREAGGKAWVVMLPTARKHLDVVCPDTPGGILVWGVIRTPAGG